MAGITHSFQRLRGVESCAEANWHNSRISKVVGMPHQTWTANNTLVAGGGGGTFDAGARRHRAGSILAPSSSVEHRPWHTSAHCTINCSQRLRSSSVSSSKPSRNRTSGKPACLRRFSTVRGAVEAPQSMPSVWAKAAASICASNWGAKTSWTRKSRCSKPFNKFDRSRLGSTPSGSKPNTLRPDRKSSNIRSSSCRTVGICMREVASPKLMACQPPVPKRTQLGTPRPFFLSIPSGTKAPPPPCSPPARAAGRL